MCIRDRDWSGALRLCHTALRGGRGNRRVHHVGVAGGTHRKIEVLAELRTVAQSRQRASQRLGLRLLDKLEEVLSSFGAPASGFAAAGYEHSRLEESEALLKLHHLGVHHSVRMLGAQPQQPPLHLQVVLAAQLTEVSAGIKGAVRPPLAPLIPADTSVSWAARTTWR